MPHKCSTTVSCNLVDTTGLGPDARQGEDILEFLQSLATWTKICFGRIEHDFVCRDPLEELVSLLGWVLQLSRLFKSKRLWEPKELVG